MKYRAVLFDFDYTLGDSTKPIVESYTVGLTSMGWPVPDREAVRRTVGYTLEDGYTMLTGDADGEHRREFFRRFKAHAASIMVTDTVLCPGAAELLNWLNESRTPTGIVSTKGGDVLEAIFQRLGLRSRLTLIVGGQDVTKVKPDPEGLNLAVERLKEDKNAVLFCGDTVIDAETARRAGVDFCAVLNGTTPAEAFADYPHVHIAPDLADLLRWLRDGIN
ncbi:MAG: HAD family hydrolase [Oscillospiraceae bacterium]